MIKDQDLFDLLLQQKKVYPNQEKLLNYLNSLMKLKKCNTNSSQKNLIYIK